MYPMYQAHQGRGCDHDPLQASQFTCRGICHSATVSQIIQNKLSASECKAQLKRLLKAAIMPSAPSQEVQVIVMATLPRVLNPLEARTSDSYSQCACENVDLTTACCAQCGQIQTQINPRAGNGKFCSMQCPNPSSSQSMTQKCLACTAQYHRNPKCLDLNPGSTSALSIGKCLCSLCALKIRTHQVSCMSAGKVDVVQIEFDTVKFNMHAPPRTLEPGHTNVSAKRIFENRSSNC